MLRILKFLFTGVWKVCDHKWVAYKEISVYEGGGNRPAYYTYIQRCEHCGELKKFNSV